MRLILSISLRVLISRRTMNRFVFMSASPTGSETLNVSYRNGASWTNLGNIASTGWINLTATGLTTATYTIQIKAKPKQGRDYKIVGPLI